MTNQQKSVILSFYILVKKKKQPWGSQIWTGIKVLNSLIMFLSSRSCYSADQGKLHAHKSNLMG